MALQWAEVGVEGEEICTIVKILLNAFAFRSQEMKMYVISQPIPSRNPILIRG